MTAIQKNNYSINGSVGVITIDNNDNDNDKHYSDSRRSSDTGDMPRDIEEIDLITKSINGDDDDDGDKQPLIGNEFCAPEVRFKGHHKNTNSIGSFTSHG